MKQVFLCDAVRTPIGRYAGALAQVRADDLAAIPIRELMQRNPGVDWGAMDDVILGCANQAGEDNRNVARMASLLAGLPESCSGNNHEPALRIGHGCSGYGDACHRLRRGGAHPCGWSRVDVARAIRNRQGGVGISTVGRDLRHHDRVAVCQSPDAKRCTARTPCRRPLRTWLATAQWNGPRRTRLRGAARCVQPVRWTCGFFAEEIVPVETPGKKQKTVVSQDEHPRPDTTLEKLAALKPLFPVAP